MKYIEGGCMVNYSVREVIEQAVQTEKLGAGFYAAMAARFQKNEEFRMFFEKLAKKEVQHEKTFAKLRAAVGDDDTEGWDEVSPYLRAIVESAFFLGKGKALTAMGSVRKMSDAVERALSFEKETLFYYYGIRDGLKDTKVIDKIIEEEKKHVVWLNALRDKFLK